MAWSLLAGALLFAVYVRVRLRDFPLERDEGEFAYAGQLILQGVPPYKLAYNMKLPGTYLAYAALMALFGQTTAGIHLGLLAVNMATIVLLYRFVRELFDPFAAGMAAVAYSILSVSPTVLGMAAHATHFVAFFGLAGTYLLWQHLQSGRWSQAFASGLLLGIAFLMKQQGVFLMIFGGGFLLLHGLRLAAYPRKRLPVALGLYSLAALLPYSLICFWLWRAGVWQKFWFWTVEYASKYLQNIPFSQAGTMLRQTCGEIVESNWPLGLIALAGIAGAAILGRRKPGLPSFVFGFLAFSFFCVCPGYYFRQHYFILMLPVVAMLVGVGSRLLWDLACGRFWRGKVARSTTVEYPAASVPALRQKRGRSKHSKPEPTPAVGSGLSPLSAFAALALLAVTIGTIGMQGAFFFTWTPLQACRVRYGNNPFPECPVVADYIEQNTTPEDTIAVLGSEPEICFDARRKSATGYIYTYGMMEPQPFARRMQAEMIQEIEAARPQYIVVVNVISSWLPQNQERLIWQWLEIYVPANYRRVGVADIVAADHTEYRWDSDTVGYQPRSQANLLVFRRK